MSHNFSKGSQVIGDLKAADDAERNTLIDFGEDQIDFQTSGSVRLRVNNSGVQSLNGTFSGNLNGTSSNATSDNYGVTLAGGVFEIDQGMFQSPTTNPTYFPSDDTWTERTSPAAVNFFVAPFDGELIKIVVRSVTDFSAVSLTASLHLGTNGNATYNSSPSVSVAMNGLGSNQALTFDFMGLPSASFSEGDIYGFSLEKSTAWSSETIRFVTVVRYNPYSS